MASPVNSSDIAMKQYQINKWHFYRIIKWKNKNNLKTWLKIPLHLPFPSWLSQGRSATSYWMQLFIIYKIANKYFNLIIGI